MKLIAILAGALLMGGGIAAVQLVGSSDPAGAGTTSTGTTTVGTTTLDATTAGTTTAETTTGLTTTTPAPAATGEDISGPCDELEHANDPRCTGGAVDDDRSGTGGDGDDHDDDRSGRGGGGDDDHDDDRSGSNSGRS
jgi:hypothetical protein